MESLSHLLAPHLPNTHLKEIPQVLHTVRILLPKGRAKICIFKVKNVCDARWAKIHILSKNSRIEKPNFYKIHHSEISIFTKFTFLKSKFSQNSPI